MDAQLIAKILLVTLFLISICSLWAATKRTYRVVFDHHHAYGAEVRAHSLTGAKRIAKRIMRRNGYTHLLIRAL